jgi:hypothetical protein
MFDKARCAIWKSTAGRVSLRADFNVPLGSRGEVADDNAHRRTLAHDPLSAVEGRGRDRHVAPRAPEGEARAWRLAGPGGAGGLARLTRMDGAHARPIVGGPESARLAKAHRARATLMLLREPALSTSGRGEEERPGAWPARLAATAATPT